MRISQRKCNCAAELPSSVGKLENRNSKLEKAKEKVPTVHPARAAGWGGGAKNKPPRVGHPKAFSELRRGHPPFNPCVGRRRRARESLPQTAPGPQSNLYPQPFTPCS